MWLVVSLLLHDNEYLRCVKPTLTAHNVPSITAKMEHLQKGMTHEEVSMLLGLNDCIPCGDRGGIWYSIVIYQLKPGHELHLIYTRSVDRDNMVFQKAELHKIP